ncbi:acyl-CoA N-acyltransferase [Xylariales sp. PMI_506]|nr:acyl-CoA N-acyltransferase [Xylariales sp. PMI_506]
MSSPPQSPITVRPASVSEALEIAELGAHVFTVTGGSSIPPRELEAFLASSYTRAAVTKDLEDSHKDIIVATDANERILGFAYLNRASTSSSNSEACIATVQDKAELQRLYVHPSVQGQGIGRQLASRVEDVARERGFKNVWLGVWQENQRAIKAYERWGYRHVGTHDFVIGTLTNTDLVMLKHL